MEVPRSGREYPTAFVRVGAAVKLVKRSMVDDAVREGTPLVQA